MDRQSITHITLGAATIAVLLTLFAFGYRDAGHAAVEDSYDVLAEFDAVDGLSVGGPVLLAGLPVGTVRAIDLNRENNRPVVTMTLRTGIELPFDSTAKIVSDGLAGGKYLKLVPGGEFEMMEPGDMFEYTQGSILLEELLEKVILMAEARRAAKGKAAGTGD